MPAATSTSIPGGLELRSGEHLPLDHRGNGHRCAICIGTAFIPAGIKKLLADRCAREGGSEERSLPPSAGTVHGGGIVLQKEVVQGCRRPLSSARRRFSRAAAWKVGAQARGTCAEFHGPWWHCQIREWAMEGRCRRWLDGSVQELLVAGGGRSGCPRAWSWGLDCGAVCDGATEIRDAAA